MRVNIFGLVAAAGIVIAVGAGIAGASPGPDQGEVPISGDALAQASAAALAETGGGTVTETKINDEDSFYQVEVTLADGNQVDVQLDQTFGVVGTKNDGAAANDN
ncbi:hypothetical protein TUM20985_00410 [Mycobacterium antarcticum]|uniref:PepSY domain-containing protein n=1 Tax=Mycolicibacterium sp. TUM20985 TaxID=3023370 RepID=UPI002573D31A|nr:PepSY domain-containing protein [Mycolicibacterium sp. TUM20985]BDX29494.1 hypothetical protein TUM20985_00410 [Mycolicibacterium sp. TUM20985]